MNAVASPGRGIFSFVTTSTFQIQQVITKLHKFVKLQNFIYLW